MLFPSIVISICISSISAKPTNTSLEAIKLVLSSSFYGKINLLYVKILTDLEEDKLTFSDMLDDVLSEERDFQLQIDVNNDNDQRVGDNNLWFIDSYQSFWNLESQIRKHGGDAPVFYLIFLKTSQSSLNLMERLFASMLSLMIVNVNIIIEDTETTDVILYTYFPYREAHCHSTAPVELLRFKSNSVETLHSFYPEKAENLQGCTLKIASRNPVFFKAKNIKKHKRSLEVGGLEKELLNELAGRMNFKVHLIERFTFEKVLFLENGTAFGTYKLIQENKAHIMIGFFKHGPLQDHFVTPSQTYFRGWVSIALWRPPYIFRKFTWLFYPFEAITWLSCLLLLISATVCVFIATKLPFLVRFLDLNPKKTRLTNISSMALGLSIEHLPTTNFIRLCFIVWSFGTLTIRATYEGKLFDSYRSLSGVEPPLTVRQLLAQNYTIYSQFSYRFLLNELGGTGSFTYQALPRQKVLGKGTQNIAIIASFVYLYTVYNREELEHMAVEPLFYEYVCLFLQKHSILAPKINAIIFRMEEAGLFVRWRAYYEILNNIHAGIRRDKNFVPELGPIRLIQFKYTLLLFVVPICVSIVVFLFELYWKAIQRFLNLLMNLNFWKFKGNRR